MYAGEKPILHIVSETGRKSHGSGAIDHVAMAVMCPAWVAMDHAGKALTPIITHQDRRSVEIAQQLEQRVGKALDSKVEKQVVPSIGELEDSGVSLASVTGSFCTSHSDQSSAGA